MKQALLDLALLDPNPIQNPRRHDTEHAVASILEDMEDGIRIPITVVRKKNGRFAIVQGHRRTSASRRKGLTKIPAIILPEGTDPVKAFLTDAKTSRRPVPADWFHHWAMRPDLLRDFPKPTQSAILAYISVFGLERSRELAKTGQANTSVGKKAKDAYHLLVTKDVNAGVTPKKLGEWMLEHGTTVVNLFQTNPSKRVLLKFVTRVKQNKPFPIAEWA